MTQLNEHMYRIQKTNSPRCSCGHPQENVKHFIFHCSRYNRQREELYNNIHDILNHDIRQQSKTSQLDILLHGSGLGGVGGRLVAEHFKKFLQLSGRFAGDH